MNDRAEEDAIHALVLNVISRETGDVEAQMKFVQPEIDMPGYVEHVERGYDGTPWRTERVWLITPPASEGGQA